MADDPHGRSIWLPYGNRMVFLGRAITMGGRFDLINTIIKNEGGTKTKYIRPSIRSPKHRPFWSYFSLPLFGVRGCGWTKSQLIIRPCVCWWLAIRNNVDCLVIVWCNVISLLPLFGLCRKLYGLDQIMVTGPSIFKNPFFFFWISFPIFAVGSYWA